MQCFEELVRIILEQEGYWVRNSYKVSLTKEEKVLLGKPSHPRVELDLIAFKASDNTMLIVEAKSYIDSPGVNIDDLRQETAIASGRYKLFTCKAYREITLHRLKEELLTAGMINSDTTLRLALAVGKVYRDKDDEIKQFFNDSGWLYFSPNHIINALHKLGASGYEDSVAIITAKLLSRNMKPKDFGRSTPAMPAGS